MPATPSARVVRDTTVPVVDVEEVEESPSRAGPSSAPEMYQPEWENIFKETLNNPLLRAEWVAQALPSAELRPFVRAETFDICDITNQAAILVKLYVCD